MFHVAEAMALNTQYHDCGILHMGFVSELSLGMSKTVSYVVVRVS